MGKFKSFRVFIILFTIVTSKVTGQDTISINAGINWFQSNNNYQSHWLQYNQTGIVEDAKSQVLFDAGIKVPYTVNDKLKFETGMHYVLKPGRYKSFLQELYFKANYGFLELSVGKQNRLVGLFDPELSSGSMGISSNARPLPIIGAGIPEYWDVPGLKGWLAIKGYLIHGWFEKDRFVESPRLHEKWMYLRIGDKLPVTLVGGFTHFAQWAGMHPTQGQLPNTFKDFLKVFFARGGGSGGESSNALGNHLGLYDIGFDIDLNNYNILIYRQKTWEDRSGLMEILNDPDGLLGLCIKPKNQKYISNILYEFMHATWQSGPGIPDPTDKYPTEEDNYGNPFGGRDDYYNNYIYKSGWTYHDMIIGTPLFYTKDRALKFMPDLTDTYGNIVNNRVNGHHFGIQGEMKFLKYRLLGTFTRNHGTYSGANKGRFNWASIEEPDFDYEFAPPLDQFYFLVDTRWELSECFDGIVKIGYDTGEIYDNFGFQVGINYSIEIPYSIKKGIEGK